MTLIAAFLLIMAAGAAFIPLASGPDEPGHYIHAAAVVRGQWATLNPVVPAAIDRLHRFAGCLAFQPDVTAACQAAERAANPSALVVSDTGAGYYNPVFYAWVGLASLVKPSVTGLYLGRILAAIVTAAVLGWSVSFLLRTARSRWATISVLLAITPMLLFLGSVVNPSAWEISAALGVTVAAWAILMPPREVSRKWKEAHTLLVAAGCVMIVSRGLSPVFLAIVLLAVALAAGASRLNSALRIRVTWLALSPLFIAAVASLAWVALHGTNYVGVSAPGSLWEGIRSIPIYYDKSFDQVAMMYGTLGWLDVSPPEILVLCWLGVVAAFLFICFCASSTSSRWGIAALGATVIVLPGVLAGTQWSGIGWQGRYTLPLVVSLLVLAGLSADRVFGRADLRSTVLRSPIEITGWTLALVLFTAGFVVMMEVSARRYLVGESTSLLGSTPVWEPPVPVALVAAVMLFGLATVTLVVGLGPRSAKPS